MEEPKKDYSKRFEKLMRDAGARRQLLAARLLENERRFRVERERTDFARLSRVEQDLRRHAEQLKAKTRIKNELKKLTTKLADAAEKEERILLKAEIAHLRALLANLGFRPPRKPPESGVPVPAVSPKGPLPKLGGAEAPLEFD